MVVNKLISHYVMLLYHITIYSHIQKAHLSGFFLPTTLLVISPSPLTTLETFSNTNLPVFQTTATAKGISLTGFSAPQCIPLANFN